MLASTYRPFIGTILQGGRPGAFSMLIACSVLTNAVFNGYLIPVFGIYGAAAATASVYVLEILALVVIVRKLFGITL